jgi:hypothetical protein
LVAFGSKLQKHFQSAKKTGVTECVASPFAPENSPGARAIS